MLTYSQSIARLQVMTKTPTTDTANTALLTQFWNESIQAICSIGGGKWWFLEVEKEVETTANQAYVIVPNNMRKIIDIRQTNGSGVSAVIYLIRMVFDSFKWNSILSAKLGTSNVPWYAYRKENKVYIQPIPSETGNIITIRGRRAIKDLSIVDVTSVTVATATNGSTAVTVSGSMTQDFVGRFIRITETSATNGGDGYWYEIGSVTNATTINLSKPYEGESIVTGTAACTIGQVPFLPEAYQLAPIYRALALWLQINDPLHSSERINAYWRLYDGGVEAGLSEKYGGFIGQMMEESGESAEGAYVSPSEMNGGNGQFPPYWYPWQNASGLN